PAAGIAVAGQFALLKLCSLLGRFLGQSRLERHVDAEWVAIARSIRCSVKGHLGFLLARRSRPAYNVGVPFGSSGRTWRGGLILAGVPTPQLVCASGQSIPEPFRSVKLGRGIFLRQAGERPITRMRIADASRGNLA